ncbi:unnamed protein product [Cyprideis torosa]|uniref:RUN and TBC1 domain-containing protein 3 n=1 Tax=Cyprideis torosa TaxID=163714 RepID=A0A7R8W737_9CRUS|nr:unnamed protein product [Cyprideis torosa]CAG0887153.1 unnamed protein product [Cyprideis torosa]
MDLAKHLFTREEDERTPYSKHNPNSWDEDVASVCEDDDFSDRPPPGGPFSAVIPSMWPKDIGRYIRQYNDVEGPTDCRYDEFGFKVEEDTLQESSPMSSDPYVEDAGHRLKWLAYLEFAHGKDGKELSWDSVDAKLTYTDKLKGMVTEGIPHSLRPQVWVRLSGALVKKQSSDTTYTEILNAASSDQLVTAKQVEKDLLRTLPGNACFSSITAPGVSKLRRVLRSVAWLYPHIGYCQGMGFVAACLLLVMDEETAFWMMCAAIEDLLPPSYYSNSLLGIQADQRVLRELIGSFLPAVDAILKEHDMDIGLITVNWFLTLFASVLQMKVLVRIWDLFFCDGSIVLFQIAMGMMKLCEERIVKTKNSAELFAVLSELPGSIRDTENLLKVSFDLCGSSLTDVTIGTGRRRQLAYLMAAEGPSAASLETDRSWITQKVYRRSLKRSKSLVHVAIFGDPDGDDDLKTKNIRQTELLVSLKEAILLVGRHFQQQDLRLADATLSPDYSMASHSKDHDHFAKIAASKRKRAKAIMDFERHEEDELGFRLNDVITIVSMKDEHCWVGELNGLRGWFPAKFVEILDERSKEYSPAGDDSICPIVADYVRGTFSPALKAVLEQGMKRPYLLGGPCHPWLFIEEVSSKEVEKDYESVYSRLVLCRTFRLDEDGKVLTPEELLYRSVTLINRSHDPHHAQMDVKLRSLICLGLNEQALHLWLEVLANSPLVHKWYTLHSFMASPGWVQIKCELRVLAQFPFQLDPDWELPSQILHDTVLGVFLSLFSKIHPQCAMVFPGDPLGSSAGKDEEKSDDPSLIRLNFWLEAKLWECGVRPMMGIDTVKSMALTHFLSPNDAISSLPDFRLAHIRQRRVLPEDGDVGREGLRSGDDILILRKRKETMSEMLDRTPMTAPTLADIKRQTAHLEAVSVKKTHIPTPSIPDLTTNIRRILMTLCRRCVALQLGNPLSAAIIRQAKEKLEGRLNPQVDKDKLNQLKDMGFLEHRATKALLLNRMVVADAMEWLLLHADDADIDEPFNLRLLSRQARDRHPRPAFDERDVCHEEIDISVVEAPIAIPRLHNTVTPISSRTRLYPASVDSVRVLFQNQDQFENHLDDRKGKREGGEGEMRKGKREGGEGEMRKGKREGGEGEMRKGKREGGERENEQEDDDDESLDEPLSGLSLPGLPTSKQLLEDCKNGPTVHDIEELIGLIRDYRHRLFLPNRRALGIIRDMGFSEVEAVAALRASNNARDAAIDWLLNGRKPTMDEIEGPMHPEAPAMKVVLSNPAIVSAMTKPKVLSAFIAILTAPRSAPQWMGDPDIALALQTIYRIYHTEKRHDAFSPPQTAQASSAS